MPMGEAKRAAATMGKPNGLVAPNPSTFLRTREKEPRLPTPKPPTNPKPKMNPAVPRRTEKPVMGLVSAKNFITTNAIEAILAQPKNKPTPEDRWYVSNRIYIYIYIHNTYRVVSHRVLRHGRKVTPVRGGR